MKVITIRSQIREVAEKWRAHKCITRGWVGNNAPVWTGRDFAVYQRLAALDPETATAADVEAIIGNDTWACAYWCGECGKESDTVVRFGVGNKEGGVSEYDHNLCIDCIGKMLDAMTDEAAP